MGEDRRHREREDKERELIEKGIDSYCAHGHYITHMEREEGS